jgi:hypothetical protein
MLFLPIEPTKLLEKLLLKRSLNIAAIEFPLPSGVTERWFGYFQTRRWSEILGLSIQDPIKCENNLGPSALKLCHIWVYTFKNPTNKLRVIHKKVGPP